MAIGRNARGAGGGDDELPPRTVNRSEAARAIDAFLLAIGRDPAREPDLVGTGARVADAYLDELCDGYDVDVGALLASNAIAGAGELVVMRDVAVSTMCPHHLMPATGTATVAFAPRGTIVGLGALVKLVDAFAHRLTLQEQIGERVVGALMEHVKPGWAGCRLVLEHGCVVSRGERRHGARAETLALAGAVQGETLAMAHRALGVGT
jgi:GTP cyclohydrolase I